MFSCTCVLIALKPLWGRLTLLLELGETIKLKKKPSHPK